jgi:hypothetical protein
MEIVAMQSRDPITQLMRRVCGPVKPAPFVSDAALDRQFEQYVQEKEKGNVTPKAAHELVGAQFRNREHSEYSAEAARLGLQPVDYAFEDQGVFLRPQAD